MILVVEDEPRLRTLYRDALAIGGFVVVAVEDGIEALRYIDSARPAAVVLDLGLPGLSGRDVEREMASHPQTEAIPIVLVTGDEDIADAARFACVLRKPVDPADLLDAVRKCLRNHRRNAAPGARF